MKIGGIEIAKWEKKTDDGKTFTSFSFQKSYKDKNTDEWKHTAYFNLSDLPILASLILLTVGKSAKVVDPSVVDTQKRLCRSGEFFVLLDAHQLIVDQQIDGGLGLL